MDAYADDDFFRAMQGFSDFEGVAEADNYHPLPDGWALVLADIEAKA